MQLEQSARLRSSSAWHIDQPCSAAKGHMRLRGMLRPGKAFGPLFTRGDRERQF
jgi:hypothetical protein